MDDDVVLADEHSLRIFKFEFFLVNDVRQIDVARSEGRMRLQVGGLHLT